MLVTTRTATEVDLPFLLEVDRHVSRQNLSGLVDLGRVMVAVVDGAAVGSLRWGLFWDQVPFMNLLWVVPEWRGQGIGTALVEGWEAAQVARGHAMVLTSTVSSETAQHFYRQIGYVDCGALVLPDEAAELILRKTLGG